MKYWIWCLGILVCLSCLNKSSQMEVVGTLVCPVSSDSNPQGFVPNDPWPSIIVRGEAPEKYPVSFEENDSASKSVPFRVSNLPKGESVIFQITHSSLDSVYSFPFLVGEMSSLSLGVLPSGTLQAIFQQAESSFKIKPISSRGTILGFLNPLGNSNGCQPWVGVELNDSLNNPTAITPFYFNSNSALVTNQFQDLECGYVFFNVPSNLYKLRFHSSVGNISEKEVYVYENSLSFGIY